MIKNDKKRRNYYILSLALVSDNLLFYIVFLPKNIKSKVLVLCFTNIYFLFSIKISANGANASYKCFNSGDC